MCIRDRLHHSGAEGDLAVGGHDDGVAATDAEDGGGANAACLSVFVGAEVERVSRCGRARVHEQPPVYRLEPRILDLMHMVATSSGKMQRVLVVSLAATFCYVVATFYFGLRAHSLALISEAGHNVSDMLAIALSFVAVYFQRRPATDEKTFGYQRAGVLAAFVNALTLMVLAGWIAISAVHRLYAPVAVEPRLMMYVAAAGVLMNGAIAGLLWKFSGDVNIRSVFLHMLGDTLSTAAVIAGGVGILLSGMMWIDPVLSILIAGMILWLSLIHIFTNAARTPARW